MLINLAFISKGFTPPTGAVLGIIAIFFAPIWFMAFSIRKLTSRVKSLEAQMSLLKSQQPDGGSSLEAADSLQKYFN